MFDLFYDNPVAGFAGLTAMAGLAVFPLCRSRSGLLSVQLCVGISFTIYYAMLDVPGAAAVNLLGVLQTAAALASARGRILNMIGYGLIVMMVGSGMYFWSGPASTVSVTAMTLIALGRMQVNPLPMRLLIFAGGVTWIAHGLLLETWLALTANLISVMIGAVAIRNIAHRQVLAPSAA